MSFGFSAADFVSLTQLAWTVYRSYKDAPEAFQNISSEFANLHVVLKELDELVSSSRFPPDKASDLQHIADNCRSVLDDAQSLFAKYRSLGTASRRTWDRFNFGQDDVQKIRSRLISVTSILSAFNSSLTNSTQLLIINMLEQILADVQSGRRETSVISTQTLQALDESQETQDDIWSEIEKELEEEGISKDDLAENRGSVVQWIKRAIETGAWNELTADSETSEQAQLFQPTPQSPTTQLALPEFTPSIEQFYTASALSKDDKPVTNDPRIRQVEVISATYGPMDITERLRRFFKKSTRQTETSWTFVPDNYFCGGDPHFRNQKVFAMVWRTVPIAGQPGSGLGTIETVRALEGSPVTIDLRLSPDAHPRTYSDPRTLEIISASYFTLDVTRTVREYAQIDGGAKLEIDVDNAVFLQDPGVGWVKSLTVTYAYQDHGELIYGVKTALEGARLSIPPKLVICCANFGGLDVTEALQARVDLTKQRLDIDRNAMFPGGPDPWVGVKKTLSIVYVYGNDRIQLLITPERPGMISLVPVGPPRRIQFGPPKGYSDLTDPQAKGTPFEHSQLSNLRLLSVIWGYQTVSAEKFWSIAESPIIKCTNDWFGFDGNLGWVKTCQVFVQNSRTGAISCVTAHEGDTLHVGDQLVKLGVSGMVDS